MSPLNEDEEEIPKKSGNDEDVTGPEKKVDEKVEKPLKNKNHDTDENTTKMVCMSRITNACTRVA